MSDVWPLSAQMDGCFYVLASVFWVWLGYKEPTSRNAGFVMASTKSSLEDFFLFECVLKKLQATCCCLFKKPPLHPIFTLMTWGSLTERKWWFVLKMTTLYLMLHLLWLLCTSFFAWDQQHFDFDTRFNSAQWLSSAAVLDQHNYDGKHSSLIWTQQYCNFQGFCLHCVIVEPHMEKQVCEQLLCSRPLVKRVELQLILTGQLKATYWVHYLLPVTSVVLRLLLSSLDCLLQCSSVSGDFITEGI